MFVVPNKMGLYMSDILTFIFIMVFKNIVCNDWVF